MKLSKTISLILGSIMLISTLGGCSSNIRVSADKHKMHQYIKENYSLINPDKENDFSDLAIMDNDLKYKEIFFTGEAHGIKANVKLNMKFLKYFKEKTDFKYYLCELSYSDAYFLNKFLENGDMKILEDMYKPLKGTFAWNKDSYNQWKELYEFNKSLPEDKKIQVVGIDIEHQPVNALRYMNSVLPKKEAPKEISSILGELNTIWNGKGNVDDNELGRYCEKLKKDIEQKENIYKQYLGEDFLGFKLVNENILYRNEAYSARGYDFDKIRDERMYENFKQVYETLPKGKYYGQWGLNHIFQNEQEDVKWVAAAMNGEYSQLNSKILSIAYVYDNCKYMSKEQNQTYSVGDVISYNSKQNILNGFIKQDYTLFKLNGKDSPFSSGMIWPFVDGKPNKGVTTDFFQYVVVIRNSQATEPLNDQY